MFVHSLFTSMGRTDFILDDQIKDVIWVKEVLIIDL